MRSSAWVVISAAVIVTVSCTDTSGPESRCERGTLELGGSVSGTLSQGACTGNGEFAQTYLDYKVNLVSGQRYLFTLRADAAWRPQLELLSASDGTLLQMGWSDDIVGAGAHSELLLVSPSNGPATLRVTAGLGAQGAFTLRSSQCGGSSQVFEGTIALGAQGTIDASDCVLHDRLMDNDSAHADTYVVYLDKNAVKSIRVKARGESVGTFIPAIVFTGPFTVDGSLSLRQFSVSSADSLITQVGGSNVAGNYILAVAGSTPNTLGAYTLTVGPAAQ